MTRYLIWLSQSIIETYSPLFQILSVIEVCCITVSLLTCPIFSIMVWRAQPLHRNVRLTLLQAIAYSSMGCIARLVMLFYQHFSYTDRDKYVIIVFSLLRESAIAFVQIFTFGLTFERIVATIKWSWYEKQTPATIIVFVAEFIIIAFYTGINAFIYIFEFCSSPMNLFIFSSTTVISAGVFRLLYLQNDKMHRKMARGAMINSYSVAKSYQIQENLAIIKTLMKISVPTAFFTIPSFVFFFIFILLPEENAYILAHSLLIALFDVWIAIMIMCVFPMFPLFDDKFKKSIQSIPVIRSIFKSFKRPSKGTTSLSMKDDVATDTYFDMLDRDLTRVVRVTSARTTRSK